MADAVGHLKAMNQQAAGQQANGSGVQQPSPVQADPHDVLIHLENAGPHMKQHLDKIANDPTRKQQVKQYSDAWMNLSKVADNLMKQVQQMNASQPNRLPQLIRHTSRH
jgi:hypothetical protein